MPKTTKRLETKRAAKIERAHSTALPKLETKEPQRRSPGYKAPARGAARYPWAIVLSVAIILIAVILLFTNHVGPFAVPPKNTTLIGHQTATAQAQKTASAAAPTATAIAKVGQTDATAVVKAMPAAQQKKLTDSPCLNSSIVSKITDTSAAPTAAAFNSIKHTYDKAPSMTIDTRKIYCAGINTNRGLMVVELDPALAPQTVNNFVYLAENKFYDGIKFHRVNPQSSQTPPYIVQTGDPKGDGTGGPGYKFNDEQVKGDYTAGTLAMANSGKNTNGSQFFINLSDNTKGLAKSYNLFGQVVKGMDVLLQIQGPGDATNSKSITPDVMNHVLVVPAS